MLRFYNTLGRKVENFVPIHKNSVRLYTCGPTVYDYPHIGNWAAYIRWDMLARTLKVSGYGVNWVMNITDVGHLTSDDDTGEDKLEAGARREGKTAWQIAEFYTDAFKQGLRELNISLPFSNLFKATDYIKDQVNLIKQIEEKGYAYVIDDGVYFDTSKLKDYGKLQGITSSATLQTNSRIDPNPQKRNPRDFALWKFTPGGKKRDMEWDSPWGRGFPGWHIECSAIAMNRLGETLDIHAGGVDHIATHHTNEIAQSESVTSRRFSRFWIHSEFYTVSGTKISKSLRNGITLANLKNHKINPIEFRLFVLQSHYRAHADFSWADLQAASNRLKGLQTMADLRFQPVENSPISSNHFAKFKSQIIKFLQDDLNTPEALAALSGLESLLLNSGVNKNHVNKFGELIDWLDEVFGLRLSASEDLTYAQKELLARRSAAREAKDWAQSDEIRDTLEKEGVGVNDGIHDQLWHRL